jgi:hypothetical protein
MNAMEYFYNGETIESINVYVSHRGSIAEKEG